MSDASISIAAIVVNYAAASVIMEHIDKLIGELREHQDWHLYIVDNASPNNEYAELCQFVDQRELSANVSVIDAGGNLGFAGGNNIAFERARARGAEFVFFLNPDAYPLPGALRPLIDCLRDDPEAAIAGAKLQNLEGAPQSCFFRFPSLIREFAFETEIAFLLYAAGRPRPERIAGDKPFETDWVSGAAFLMRAQAAGAKLMDDNFFLYYEETDMMLDLKRRGWRIWHVPQSHIVHLGGVSTGVEHGVAATRRLPPYWFRSWRYYFGKNHGALYRFGAGLAKTLGVLVYHAKCVVKGKRNAKPRRYLADIVAACVLAQGPAKTSEQ